VSRFRGAFQSISARPNFLQDESFRIRLAARFSAREAAMNPVVPGLFFSRLLLGFFIVAIGHGAQAAVSEQPSEGGAGVASPRIKAHVEGLNRAFSGVSFTAYWKIDDPVINVWAKILIRGRAVTIDARGGLRLKHETCASRRLLEIADVPKPRLVEQNLSACAELGDWQVHESVYALASVQLPTIAVRE
jgi:hypothetical protein